MGDMGYLRERIARLCLRKGHFTLRSGVVSDSYFDMKRAILDGGILREIALELNDLANKLPIVPDRVAGHGVGAIPLVAAMVMQSGTSGAIVRDTRKEHGTCSLIENEPPLGSLVVVVDDVITTGGSVIKVCEALSGCRLVGILAVIDRGGSEPLSARYKCPVKTLFKMSDFVDES